MLPALSALLLLAAPQTAPLHGGRVPGSTQPGARRLDYPVDPMVDRFAPFTDSGGQAQATAHAAVGIADFDADGHEDAWFLSATTATAGELSVQMARASSLGRFRDWHREPAGPWLHGATFRSVDYSLGDRVLLVDASNARLHVARYGYPFGGNPRGGSFSVDPSWTVGSGSYEIATRDDDGDGHDDIVVLQAPRYGWTRVKKLCMGNSLGFLAPESERVLELPWLARELRLLDHDGDGRSDVLVTLPGIGLLLLRDDGRTLQPALHVPWPWPMQGTFVGDADRDGRDDLGLVTRDGVLLVLRSTGAGTTVALVPPPGAGPLLSARVVGDRTGALTTVAGVAADGRGLVLWPHLGGETFGASELRAPVGLAAYGGPGPTAAHVVVHDLDGDGDEDLLAQLPDRAHWVSLRNDELRMRPSSVMFQDLGKVGETGYRHWKLHIGLPALPPMATAVELAVFLKDITQAPARHVYWGRLIAPLQPGQTSVRMHLYSQTERKKLQAMIRNAEVHRFPGAITAGGDAILSLHALLPQDPVTGAVQRLPSTIVHHDGGDEGNKSALGVSWQVQASPPTPTADDELLPWN